MTPKKPQINYATATTQVLRWASLIGTLAETTRGVLDADDGNVAMLVGLGNAVLEKARSPIRLAVVEKKR